MRWMRRPSTSASITIGISCSLLSPSVEKEISWSVEKLWVVFCLVIHCRGWTMKIVVAFSLLGASPFFAAFACSPRFPPCFISLTRYDSCPDLTASSICLLRWMHSYEAILPPVRLVLIFEIGPFVKVWSVTGFMMLPCWRAFFFDWLVAATSPLRKSVVTLIISSTDFDMLSFNFFIRSGLVIPCMNPDIFMHSGAPLT
ncbi:hypothetical protein Tco_0660823, partial [Tanacetum coccineum]